MIPNMLGNDLKEGLIIPKVSTSWLHLGWALTLAMLHSLEVTLHFTLGKNLELFSCGKFRSPFKSHLKHLPSSLRAPILVGYIFTLVHTHGYIKVKDLPTQCLMYITPCKNLYLNNHELEFMTQLRARTNSSHFFI